MPGGPTIEPILGPTLEREFRTAEADVAKSYPIALGLSVPAAQDEMNMEKKRNMAFASPDQRYPSITDRHYAVGIKHFHDGGPDGPVHNHETVSLYAARR